MRLLLPAAVLLLIHFTPTSIGAPIAVSAPVTQPPDSFSSEAKRSLSLKAREPTKALDEAAKAKSALGQPTDYAHVDLEGMLSDLTIPSEVNPNSNKTATATKTQDAA